MTLGRSEADTRYELKQVDSNMVVYMLKPDARGAEAPHWLCATCFGRGKKGFLQGQGRTKDGAHMTYHCGTCGAEAVTHWNRKITWD
jgi:hypothetical protein